MARMGLTSLFVAVIGAWGRRNNVPFIARSPFRPPAQHILTPGRATVGMKAARTVQGGLPHRQGHAARAFGGNGDVSSSTFAFSASKPRREALLFSAAAVVAPSALLLDAKATLAADAQVDRIVVSGAPSQIDINGDFLITDKFVNGRAVYQRAKGDYYLLLNDCEQFQIGKSASGECDGIAKAKGGRWKVDGQVYNDFKLKPVKSQAAAPPAPRAAASQGEASASAAPPQDDDASAGLTDDYGVNVGKYIKNKGGGDFLTNAMTLNAEEKTATDSLEARLNSKLGIR